MASSSNPSSPNYHYIHSVKFYDIDGPTEPADTGDEDEIDIKQADLLHTMNKDADLAHDATKAISAYNDQLIAHNNRYAKLIGSVYRNQHIATEIMQSFPDQEFMNGLNNKISDFKTLNNEFTKHFDKVHDTVAHVVEELNKKPEDRGVNTSDFTLVKEETKIEQSLMPIHNQISDLTKMINASDTMGQMISKSSL
jgi:hypothetical protein